METIIGPLTDVEVEVQKGDIYISEFTYLEANLQRG